MKHLLTKLVQGETLSTDETIEAFELIMAGPDNGATPAQIGGLLALMASREPTVAELVGAATVMRRKAKPVIVSEGLTILDTCGAGGAGSTFFNISTAAAFVAAAVGRPRGVAVAKHGNRSITSRCGSADVLEVLGVKICVSDQTLTQCLDEAGICFCFAPAHHPAMKYAAPIRKELGIPTLFNLLGPLTNPAGATRQIIGVARPELTGLFAHALSELGTEQAMIVHSVLPDGRPLGELTNFGPAQVHRLRHGMIRSTIIDPAELDVSFAVPGAVTVDNAQESASKVREVLEGRHGAAKDIVRLNAAAALMVADLAEDMREGLALATRAMDDGSAYAALDKLVALTQADDT